MSSRTKTYATCRAIFVIKLPEPDAKTDNPPLQEVAGVYLEDLSVNTSIGPEIPLCIVEEFGTGFRYFHDIKDANLWLFRHNYLINEARCVTL